MPARRPGAVTAVLPIAVLATLALLAGVFAPTSAGTPLPRPDRGLPMVDTSSHAPMPNSCSGGCSEELTGAGGSWKLQVFRNFPISGSAAVTSAVVVIHGTGRNAAGYFASMMAAASQAGATSHTLVVAPWFKTSADKPAPGEATWTNDAWKQGDGASQPSGLSSFLVMDQIMATLASKQRFPNLRRITLAGHSAGGQFTQRYAAFGLAPNALPGVRVRYVPANPSSFVYFSAARPSNNGFTVPSGSGCSGFDTYKYGLKGRTGYPARLTAAQALANYTSRDVTIINGGTDTFDNGDMDSDCAAMLEGPNRATRGANYLRYIHAIAPTSTARQRRIVVPGVDHDSDAIFASPLARTVLFSPATTLDSAQQLPTR
jgi:pimeloyl-ACP methyl ester carboxylesterase